MSDLRSQILANREMPSEIIDVPTWGDVKVKVVGLNAKQRLDVMRDCIIYDEETGEPTGETDIAQMFLHLVVQCSHDPESDERIFEDDDVEALGETPGAGVETVSSVAARLSGLGGEVEKSGPSSSPATPDSTDG